MTDRRESAAALLAIVFAACAMLPLEPRARFILVALAVGVILALLAVRLRRHAAKRRDARVDGVYDRIARIRAGRTKTRR